MPGKINKIRKYNRNVRLKKHGFFKRMSTTAGRSILSKRRLKGRHVLCVSKK